jgi:hypothetical protein
MVCLSVCLSGKIKKRCLNKALKRSPGGVRVVKCRRLRWAGYLGGMAEMRH